jgi:hypothetical protein
MRRPAAVAALTLLLSTQAAVQAPAEAARAYTPPRTSDGQPDLQGIWQVLNTAAWDIQNHAAQLGIPAGQGWSRGTRFRTTVDAVGSDCRAAQSGD